MSLAPARSALIDAAERIVAEQGLAGLTLRKVQLAAGQSNKSAVSYHFGGREALVDAVLADRAGWVDARRAEILADLDTTSRKPATHELLHALISPLVDRTLRRTPSFYGRFLAQAMQDPILTEAVQTHASTATYRQTLRQLAESVGITESAHPLTTSVSLLVITSLGYWESRAADPDEICRLLSRSCDAILNSKE